MTCPTCNAAMKDGEIHSCGAPSYTAPVLLDIRDELARIRALLEKQGAEPQQPKSALTKAQGREKRG